MATEFPLRFPNQQSKTMMRIVQIDLAILVVGLIIAAAVGFVSWRSLAWSIPFMCVLCGVMYVRYGWLRGSAQIDGQGIAVQARTGRQLYPWEDIVTINLVTTRQRDKWPQRWARFCGVDLDEPVVELCLRKSAKVALFHLGWRDRVGTDVIGLPVLMGKRISIPVRDGEAFVRHASECLAVRAP